MDTSSSIFDISFLSSNFWLHSISQFSFASLLIKFCTLPSTEAWLALPYSYLNKIVATVILLIQLVQNTLLSKQDFMKIVQFLHYLNYEHAKVHKKGLSRSGESKIQLIWQFQKASLRFWRLEVWDCTSNYAMESKSLGLPKSSRYVALFSWFSHPGEMTPTVSDSNIMFFSCN